VIFYENLDPDALNPFLIWEENWSPTSLKVEFTSSFTVYSLFDGEYMEHLKYVLVSGLYLGGTKLSMSFTNLTSKSSSLELLSI